jgi:Cof subfamily protein (haloacid dehalogenase superfamily)
MNAVRNKAIIFDIDGTVVDSPDQKLPTANLTRAFKNISQAYYCCAATGRPWSFAKDIITHLEAGNPSIVAGGTQIRDSNGDVLWQCDIPSSSLIEVLNTFSEYDNHSLLVNDYEESAYLDDKGLRVEDIDPESKAYFLEAIFVPEKEAYKLKEKLDKIDGIVCTMVVAQREGMKDLHVTNEFATKEHAITELLKLIQVDVDQTIGVGDGHNDLHLFASVKTKVAMGNAVPELKAAADIVIGDVKNDGLAEYLESLVTVKD